MRFRGAQRTLRGSDGSWRILRGPRSTEGVFRVTEAVLTWSWHGPDMVLRGPNIPGGSRGPRSPKESCWIGGVLHGPEDSWDVWGFQGFRGEDISLNVHHNPIWPFRTSRNPFDPSGTLGLLMTPCKNFNPSVAFRTHQPHRTLRTPLDPLRTDSGPLNTSWVLLGPLRNCQDPSEPLRVLWVPQDPILRFVKR